MGYNDPCDAGNSSKYHTGKVCVECGESPAGTAWSPYYCFECNVERIDRINVSLQEIADGMSANGRAE